MKTSKIVLTLVVLLLLSQHVPAQIEVTSHKGQGFPIVSEGSAATLYVSPKESETVRKAAQLFTDDIRRVTGVETAPCVSASAKGSNVIIVATIGHNKLVDKLIANHRIDAAKIRGGWEQYSISVVSNPQKGIGKALIVVGSDKRGAAYGLLSVSEKMGVSPFYWWADVPVNHSSEVWLSGKLVSESPSVKYRGIFINDEDWGLKPWAAKNFERNLGDIGPKTYAKVCELILRLKGNMLGPAMHSCTGAFYFHPESKLVADSFGIIITTSHCEPLLINTASKWEWDTKRDGDWNYKTNSNAIISKWNKRLDDASRFDNIYTMAMRGLHDSGLRGNLPLDERTSLLEKVISDQRRLLTTHIKKPITEIPQIFVPYKETMNVYENGLRVPDDITLVWVDDNYGYMKRVSNPQEQIRKGRAGVYYHISYWGAPHDYLWICTTPPVLMYEELMKAYHTGADRYWLLNVGDIKPGELGIKTFFDLAWNVGSMNINTANSHQNQFLASIFGRGYISRLQRMLDKYYQLAWSRKPEYMGWEREYDTPENGKLHDTEFSFTHYGEAQGRLADYEALANNAKSMLSELPEAQKAAFYEMVCFPILGSYQMNRKFLMAQLNHEEYSAGRKAEANWAARQAQMAADSLNNLNREYNSILNGKWKHMMAFAVGGKAKFMNLPDLNITEGIGEEPVDLTIKREQPDGYFVVDLSHPVKKVQTGGHSINLVKGLGYDWTVLQLGQPTDATVEKINVQGDRADYMLPAINSDSIEVTVYSVPFFPLYKDKATRIGLAVDGVNTAITNNKFEEYGTSWKNQVLRNAAIGRLRFAIDRNKPSHTISIICGDPGMMVEKVIVDWGGLKKSYIGPKPSCNN